MINPEVNLKAKDCKTEKKFELSKANKLLRTKNSQWELKDNNWVWNGTELDKAKTKETPKD